MSLSVAGPMNDVIYFLYTIIKVLRHIACSASFVQGSDFLPQDHEVFTIDSSGSFPSWKCLVVKGLTLKRCGLRLVMPLSERPLLRPLLLITVPIIFLPTTLQCLHRWYLLSHTATTLPPQNMRNRFATELVENRQ